MKVLKITLALLSTIIWKLFQTDYVQLDIHHGKAGVAYRVAPQSIGVWSTIEQKAFLISKISFILDKAYPNLDFQIKIVEMHWNTDRDVLFWSWTFNILQAKVGQLLGSQFFLFFANDSHDISSVLSKQISTKFKANWSIIT